MQELFHRSEISTLELTINRSLAQNASLIIEGEEKLRVYVYSDGNDYHYYKEIPYQESTGFYNRIETVEKNTDRALYNLSYVNTYNSNYDISYKASN